MSTTYKKYATKNNEPIQVQSAIEDGSGNNIVSTYATKGELWNGTKDKAVVLRIGTEDESYDGGRALPDYGETVKIPITEAQAEEITNNELVRVGISDGEEANWYLFTLAKYDENAGECYFSHVEVDNGGAYYTGYADYEYNDNNEEVYYFYITMLCYASHFDGEVSVNYGPNYNIYANVAQKVWDITKRRGYVNLKVTSANASQSACILIAAYVSNNVKLSLYTPSGIYTVELTSRPTSTVSFPSKPSYLELNTIDNSAGSGQGDFILVRSNSGSGNSYSFIDKTQLVTKLYTHTVTIDTHKFKCQSPQSSAFVVYSLDGNPVIGYSSTANKICFLKGSISSGEFTLCDYDGNALTTANSITDVVS